MDKIDSCDWVTFQSLFYDWITRGGLAISTGQRFCSLEKYFKQLKTEKSTALKICLHKIRIDCAVMKIITMLQWMLTMVKNENLLLQSILEIASVHCMLPLATTLGHHQQFAIH